MKTNKAMTTVLAAFCLPVIVGCGGGKRSGSTTERAIPAFEVAHPLVRDVTLTREYPGYISVDATIDVMGRADGVLKQSFFSGGQRVKKGQLLYIIEPTLYEDAVAQAEATLKTARAELQYVMSSYERMQEAIKSEAVSRIQLLQTEAEVKKIEAAVSNAEAALSTARLQLSYCYVKSPADGQISKGAYPVGSYIAGGGSPVRLATVYKDDRVFANFNITDRQWMNQLLLEDLYKHDPKQTYYVTVGLVGRKANLWRARLDYLSPDISLSTGTLGVRAELLQPDSLLKAGAYVSVTIPVGELKDALLVHEASIGTDQRGKYLYVVNDSNRVRYRPIEVGQLVSDTLRVVRQGLQPQERYVTKALLKVRDGMLIDPVLQPAD